MGHQFSTWGRGSGAGAAETAATKRVMRTVVKRILVGRWVVGWVDGLELVVLCLEEGVFGRGVEDC